MYVRVHLFTYFVNRFFPPCMLGTPRLINYSQCNISWENVTGNATVWGIIDLKGKKGLANRNNLNYTVLEVCKECFGYLTNVEVCYIELTSCLPSTWKTLESWIQLYIELSFFKFGNAQECTICCVAFSSQQKLRK